MQRHLCSVFRKLQAAPYNCVLSFCFCYRGLEVNPEISRGQRDKEIRIYAIIRSLRLISWKTFVEGVIKLLSNTQYGAQEKE